MNLTLKLNTIAQVWLDILANSAEINDYCTTKYGKKPTIFVGANGKSLPNETYCPAIFILPGVKTEGADEETLSYGVSVAWSISQNKVLVDGVESAWVKNISGEAIEFLGLYESDDFGQLIYEVLFSATSDNYPISRIDYDIESAPIEFPQWPGHMIITTEITATMGENIDY